MATPLGVNYKSRDFLVDTAMGRIKGYTQDFAGGLAESVDIADGEITVWDMTARWVPLAGDTEVFVSSSSAADTTPQALVCGLDINFVLKTVLVTLNGQNQVSLGNFAHVQTVTVITAQPAGDVYVAESDTLTGGVPDTQSKIQSKAPFPSNISHNGFFMVPAGKSLITLTNRGTTDATNKSAEIRTYITLLNQNSVNAVTYDLEGNLEFTFPAPVATTSITGVLTTVLPEKSMIEFTCDVETNDTRVFFAADFLVIDNNQFNLSQ